MENKQKHLKPSKIRGACHCLMHPDSHIHLDEPEFDEADDPKSEVEALQAAPSNP